MSTVNAENGLRRPRICLLHGLESLDPCLKYPLAVVYYVYEEGLDRCHATNKVANLYDINPTTVVDKYTRRLGLSAQQFGRILQSGDWHSLESLLADRYYSARPQVCGFLRDLSEEASASQQRADAMIRAMTPEQRIALLKSFDDLP